MKNAPIRIDATSDSHSSDSFVRNKKERSSLFQNQSVGEPFISQAIVQPKLIIGQSNDKYEKEADSMADQVVNNSESQVQATRDQSVLKTADSFVQKLSASQSPTIDDAVEVETEQEGATVQPMRKPDAMSSESIISKKQLDANKNQGKRLDDTTKVSMESQFGNDFSNVSIHDNAKSEGLASSINARAFAYGSDIYFNKGEYQPESKEGKRTLAHELTHVVQQGGADQIKSTQPKIQRMGGLGTQIASGIAPWGGLAPVGTEYKVSTDAGNVVTGWVAYSIFPNALRYWCHGHSLGTFAKYGYSVYSGSPLKTVIKDEWKSIPSSQTKPGDIAVWTADFGHSAKFVNPVITGGRLDPATSMLSTKNGKNALTTMSLKGIASIPEYGGVGIGVYRHV